MKNHYPHKFRTKPSQENGEDLITFYRLQHDDPNFDPSWSKPPEIFFSINEDECISLAHTLLDYVCCRFR